MKKIMALLIAIALVAAMAVSCTEEKKNPEVDTVSATDTQLTESTLDDIITEASEIVDGTSGVSLKRAALASKVAGFVALQGFTDSDLENLKKDFEEKVGALQGEAKSNLDVSFIEVFKILDKAIDEGKYDEVKADFEDAGVAEEMVTVLKTPDLAKSYSIFKSAYLTLGNSED